MKQQVSRYTYDDGSIMEICQIGISSENGRKFEHNKVIDQHRELRTQQENVLKYLACSSMARGMFGNMPEAQSSHYDDY